MKKCVLVFVAFFCFAFVAPMAGAEINTSDIASSWGDLSETEKASFAMQIAQKAEQSTSIPTVDDVEPWLKLVNSIGDGLVKLAHDMGVEANELIKTPVGMMAMGLIAYHVLGEDVLDVTIGLL